MSLESVERGQQGAYGDRATRRCIDQRERFEPFAQRLGQRRQFDVRGGRVGEAHRNQARVARCRRGAVHAGIEYAQTRQIVVRGMIGAEGAAKAGSHRRQVLVVDERLVVAAAADGFDAALGILRGPIRVERRSVRGALTSPGCGAR